MPQSQYSESLGNYANLSRDQLLTKLQEMQQIVTELQDLNANMASELYFLYGIVSNTDLSGNQKCVVIVGYREIFTHMRDELGYARVYRDDLARGCGLSAQTVSPIVKKLSESGIIGRRLVPRVDEKKFIKELHLSMPPQTLANPAGVVLQERRNHGGEREPRACPNCGEEALIQTTIVSCGACGHPVEERTRALYKREEPEEAIHDPSYEEELIDLANVPFEESPLVAPETITERPTLRQFPAKEVKSVRDFLRKSRDRGYSIYISQDSQIHIDSVPVELSEEVAAYMNKHLVVIQLLLEIEEKTQERARIYKLRVS